MGRPAPVWRVAAVVAALATPVLAAASASIGASGWAFTDRADGMSCSYVDVALLVGWPGGRPAWTDADNKPAGPRPFGAADSGGAAPGRVLRADVTALAQQWWQGRRPPDGMLLRLTQGDALELHSREDPDTTLRPQLLLRWADGRRKYLEAAADVSLDCSTYKGLGQMPMLYARRDVAVALRFDIAALSREFAQAPAGAELIVVRRPGDSAQPRRLEAFALQLPFGAPSTPRTDGLASRFPADRGIAQAPEVFAADDFEGAALNAHWTEGMRARHEIAPAPPNPGVTAPMGRALKVTIPRGQSLGLDLRYRFAARHGREPDEVYFRYYLWLAPDWLAASQGGKLPGLAGTYGKVGWGGRGWDGKLGWSARGAYGEPVPKDHAAAGRITLSNYVYHSKSSNYGEGVGWIGSGFAGLITPGRWYCIEQRVRMNTPGREDGVLQAWVDGRLVMSREDLRLRDVASVAVEEVWLNFFHGGTDPAPAAMHAWVDHVVIARQYIGPIGSR